MEPVMVWAGSDKKASRPQATRRPRGIDTPFFAIGGEVFAAMILWARSICQSFISAMKCCARKLSGRGARTEAAKNLQRSLQSFSGDGYVVRTCAREPSALVLRAACRD